MTANVTVLDAYRAKKVAAYRKKEQAGLWAKTKETWQMQIAKYPNLNGCDMAVAIVLSVHMNHKTGNAWPSFRTIAELTNRDPTSVGRSVKKLERLHFIKVIHSRSRHKSNRCVMGPGPSVDPKTLRRKKTRASSMLRVRRLDPAKLHTEPLMNRRVRKEEGLSIGALAQKDRS